MGECPGSLGGLVVPWWEEWKGMRGEVVGLRSTASAGQTGASRPKQLRKAGLDWTSGASGKVYRCCWGGAGTGEKGCS